MQVSEMFKSRSRLALAHVHANPIVEQQMTVGYGRPEGVDLRLGVFQIEHRGGALGDESDRKSVV